MEKETVYRRLAEQLGRERTILDADMREYTSFKAGGCADVLVSPADEEELAFSLKIIDEEQCPHILMGNGTNFLVRDGGFRGVILHIGEPFAQISMQDTVLEAGSGALMSAAAREAAAKGLSGFEFASGIPGSLGGGIAMNAGAYGGEIKDVLLEARAMDLQGNVHVLKGEELMLSYRHSVFQDNGWIILDAKLQLEPGNVEEIKERMKGLTRQRNEKQPVAFPSAGSFFKRPPGYYAGKLVQDAKLKGLSYGGAQVSPLHAGFIINKGGATAADIISLMKIVQNTVFDQFGAMLEPEVKIIGEQ